MSQGPPNPVFYFNWIWWTLGHGSDIFIKYHLYTPSKEAFWPKEFLNFLHGFKSAIFPELKNCQNGTFEPMHILF